MVAHVHKNGSVSRHHPVVESGTLDISIDKKTAQFMVTVHEGEPLLIGFEKMMAVIGRLNEVAGFLTADVPGTAVSRIEMLRKGNPGVLDGCP